MRIIFAGGGTAGHINPALAVAGYVREKQPDAEILYVGAVGGMEERLVKQAGFNFRGIKISGFSRKINIASLKKNIVTLKRVLTASAESREIIKDFKPDICVGTGGYVSGPILRKAAQMGIPIIIHEQNARLYIVPHLVRRCIGVSRQNEAATAIENPRSSFQKTNAKKYFY